MNSCFKHDQIVIRTRSQTWVIPHDCELLKALLKLKQLNARDLCFDSRHDCQAFVRQIALLATADELRNACPSELSDLTRELMLHNIEQPGSRNSKPLEL